jgi:hypothetical protein
MFQNQKHNLQADTVSPAGQCCNGVNPDTEEPANEFAIYIAEIHSSGPTYCKVGMVRTADGLEGRMHALKSPADLTYPEIFAAYKVEATHKFGPRSIELYIHKGLRRDGLANSGEIFLAPDGCRDQVQAKVGALLKQLGLKFTSLDVDTIAETSRSLNRGIREKLRGDKVVEATCPNEAWRESQCMGPVSTVAMIQSQDQCTFRTVLGLGFLARDVYAGSPDSVHLDLGAFGAMTVYPAPTLADALAEARAEQHLIVPNPTRTVMKRGDGEVYELPKSAISILHRDTLSRVEIHGPFQACDEGQDGDLRFTPEYLACLGDLKVSPGHASEYFGHKTRAPLSPVSYAIARDFPDLLAGLRFWAGVENSFNQELRIQDYELLRVPSSVVSKFRMAALALHEEGHPIPEKTIEWALRVFMVAV